MSRADADTLAAEYPCLGRCARCLCPTGGRRPSDEPFVCGQCYHDIYDAAGRAAVRRYLAKRRHNGSATE